MRIVIMGAQGCGKGTQGKLLAGALQVPLLGMGDVFRKAAKEASELGREIAAYQKRGDLVPDKYVIEALIRAVHSEEAKGGFVLDGYPRRENQVNELDEVLGEKTLDRVILLQLPLDEAMRRAQERRICNNPECSEVYGADNQQPEGEPCLKCGAQVVARDDDNENALKRRYAIYERETVPAIKRYAQRGLLTTVDGTSRKETVHERVLRALKAE